MNLITNLKNRFKNSPPQYKADFPLRFCVTGERGQLMGRQVCPRLRIGLRGGMPGGCVGP